MKEQLHNILGIILIITGILDGLKYHWSAQKIESVKTSKGHSRKFINVAILNDYIRLIYFIFIKQDIYLLLSSIFALICMFEMCWKIYIYYPYKTYPREIRNWVIRPNIFKYLVNSWIPNRTRKKL
jgi:hypothetical protein